MKKGKNRLWMAYICGTLILALAIVFGILHFHKRDLNDQYYQDERQIENTNITSSPMSDEGLSEFLDQYGKLNGGPIPDWAIIPTNEEKKAAQKNEMIAFFQQHQEEMEQLLMIHLIVRKEKSIADDLSLFCWLRFLPISF